MNEFTASAESLGIKAVQIPTNRQLTQMQNAEIAVQAYKELNAIVSPARSASPLVSNSMFAPVAAAAASVVPSQDASVSNAFGM